MKKLFTLVILFASILLLAGCGSSNSKIEDISFKELYNLVENKESFILEIYQDGCSHCAVFNPRFEKVLEEYNVTAKRINCTHLTEEEYNQFIKDFNDNDDIGTPTVFFIVEGKEKSSMNRLSGEPSEKEIIRKLKQNEYIKD